MATNKKPAKKASATSTTPARKPVPIPDQLRPAFGLSSSAAKAERKKMARKNDRG